MPKSGANIIQYEQGPTPFAVPCIKTIDLDNLRSTFIPKETLHYNAKALEEIMFQINLEFKLRDKTIPIWKRYKSSLTDFDIFKPDPHTGNTLKTTAVKWFPQIVKDIQTAIEELIADTRVFDTLGSYLARVFCNNTIGSEEIWNNNTKLKDGMVVPWRGSDGNGTTKILNPLTRAKSGLWPFDEDYINKAPCWVGITPGGHAQVKNGVGGIQTFDPNWPQSDIGAKTPSGTAGIVNKMTATNRPVSNRIIPASENNWGLIYPDLDQGYGYFGHPALVVQQLRWQPPIIEWWPNEVPIKDWVSNIWSNTTPNLAWVMAQPTETQWFQNWGAWRLTGYTGIIGGNLIMRAYPNPSVVEGSKGQCPYGAFYPEQESHCSCSYGAWARVDWWSNQYTMLGGYPSEDGIPMLFSGTNQDLKWFGKNTKLRLKYNISINSPGEHSTKIAFYVKIMTSALGCVDHNWQWIYTKEWNYNDVGGDILIEINLMDIMSQLNPGYRIQKRDAIAAIELELVSQSGANWIATAVDGPTGSYIPAGSENIQKCTVPDVTVTVDYIALYEPPIVGDPVTDY